jgi:hypothetical protein
MVLWIRKGGAVLPSNTGSWQLGHLAGSWQLAHLGRLLRVQEALQERSEELAMRVIPPTHCMESHILPYALVLQLQAGYKLILHCLAHVHAH